MGFSLQAFINELQSILDENIEAVPMVRKLEGAIKSGAKYAKECGLIDRGQS